MRAVAIGTVLFLIMGPGCAETPLIQRISEYHAPFSYWRGPVYRLDRSNVLTQITRRLPILAPRNALKLWAKHASFFPLKLTRATPLSHNRVGHVCHGADCAHSHKYAFFSFPYLPAAAAGRRTATG